MSEVKKLPKIIKHCMTIGEIPTSYKVSLTYEEQLLWFCKFLQDEVIPVVNNNSEVVEELKNWFETLDVQDEINNKLEEMAQSGELEQLIAQFLEMNTIFTYNNIEELKNATNLKTGSFVQTMGYYKINDGGKAQYKIREITTEDIIDNAFIVPINENLIAELIIDNKINVKNMGAYGDNIHDDTLAIQKALNKGIDVIFPDGNYIVSKNTSLNFTDNDEPCLAIINKDNMKISGINAKIKTNTHAQGIFEIINSKNITIENLIIEGLGLFPSIDGTTGRAEKGTSTEGYYTSGFWGYYKNNSYNTSENTTHRK